MGNLTTAGDVAVVVVGAIASTVVAGFAIGRLLQPLSRSIRPDGEAASLENAGFYIGALERALLYALVAAGRPEAVALIFAAKSIARFPSFKEERFAEYFLIGTLSSVLSATLVGFAVRALLGFPLVAG